MSSMALKIGDRLGLARLKSWLPHGSHDDELLLVPKDLRTADPIFARELAGGRMGLAGFVVTIGDSSPFDMASPHAAWTEALHGFGWLRHLKAGRSAGGTALGQRLFDAWIANESKIRRTTPAAFEPSAAARRVTAWLANADLLLDGADPARFQSVHRAVAQAIETLERCKIAAHGRTLVACDIALVTASLALADQERFLEAREASLVSRLGRQILDDGCHVSRNSDDAVELLLDLLPLRQCYLARGRAPPQMLVDTTGLMLGFLRAMQLGDGSPARFHGADASARDALATVLALDSVVHGTRHDLAASRFVRMEQGRTIVIMDCGGAGEGGGAVFDSPLAFEMSSGRRRVLGNCGSPAGVAPATTLEAATSIRSHATLALGSTARTGKASVTGFVREADNEQISAGAQHDGFVASYGLVHTRRLTLGDGGRTLEGTDQLDPPAAVLRTVRDTPFAIRFHIDTAAAASVDMDGSRATIQLPDEAWELTMTGARAALEPSVDYAQTGGPRAAEQIVLRGTCPGHSNVTWKLSRRS